MSSGSIANRYDYSPFGQLIADVETVENPFKFSSEYAEKETGLVYYNYRYYNPTTGKWLSRDPIQEFGGYNLYGFIDNDCVNYIDKLGNRKSIPWNKYKEDYNKKRPDLTPPEEGWAESQLSRGCVGVVAANVGYGEKMNNCYKTKEQAENAKKSMKCTAGCPKMFSVHFWNDIGDDDENPDVTFDPKTGKADFSNWDKKGRPAGGWKVDENGRPRGNGVNFDYGYVNPDGSITHADQYHNPDIDDDGTGDYHPDYPIRSGTIYESTEEEWKESYADFNSEAWCIQCSNPTFKPKGKTCSNY
ncbi:RHS repeat-associated core domain-containing protein [Lentisphaerota bacterium WC36G]|nr:hypothetical protein LJT99_09635 [Lentisphaerae bacterium WC36]